MRPCFVCRSPYRLEIEELIKRKIYKKDIARKYYLLMNVSADNLYTTLRLHLKKNHPPTLDLTPIKPEERKVEEVVDFKEYADKLLRVGMSNTMMNPWKVSHGNIIAAKRALIEESKAKTSAEAQKLMMVKFFRGNAIEGEVVDDTKQIRAENQ